MTEEILVGLDIEGPCALNDNAQETTVALATERYGLGAEVGAAFYQRKSTIDDIWGDFHKIQKDPGYSAGHTLKVILPFYKAMGADMEWLRDFARKSLRLMPHIETVIAEMYGKYDIRLVSTSYDFFVEAFCDYTGFYYNPSDKKDKRENVFCTKVDDFDNIAISTREKAILMSFMAKVAEMPIIEYNKETGEVIPEHQPYYNVITDFIWDYIYAMDAGWFLRNVHPVGQAQKLEALKSVCANWEIPKKRVMYVCDSQTDLAVVKWLGEGDESEKGLSVMFNGKGPVFRLSDIACIGDNGMPISEIAQIFVDYGRQAVRATYDGGCWREKGVRSTMIKTITAENVILLEEASVAKRKEVRGVAVGSLT